MKPRWLDRNIHTLTYYYCLCRTEKQFQRELKRLKLPREKWPAFLNTDHAGATLHAFTGADGKRIAIICLASTKGRSAARVHAMLTHEAVHLWQWHCEAIGEANPSSEFEAYAVQNITQSLIEEYHRK